MQHMQMSASVLSIQIQHAATGIYDLVQSQPPSGMSQVLL